MLFDFISGIIEGDRFALIFLALYLLILPLSFTIHEYAHGYIAYKLGDPTAKSRGRLSLNPIDHLDPMGALMMLIFGFGWAKPVPINPAYFKKRKLGMALTALAGPLSNVLLAFIGLLLQRVVFIYFIESMSYGLFVTVQMFLSMLVMINIYHAIFNLLPIPPLDGSRIVNIMLPEEYYFKMMKYERYIVLVIFLLLYLGWLDTPLAYAYSGVTTVLNNIISLIPFLR